MCTSVLYVVHNEWNHGLTIWHMIVKFMLSVCVNKWLLLHQDHNFPNCYRPFCCRVGLRKVNHRSIVNHFLHLVPKCWTWKLICWSVEFEHRIRIWHAEPNIFHDWYLCMPWTRYTSFPLTSEMGSYIIQNWNCGIERGLCLDKIIKWSYTIL